MTKKKISSQSTMTDLEKRMLEEEAKGYAVKRLIFEDAQEWLNIKPNTSSNPQEEAPEC